MTFATFTARPRSVLSGGSVRFFPVVTGNSYPVVSYSWTFGDGNTSTDATPTHTYPTVTVQTSYTVSLQVTDSHGNTASHTETDFITLDAAANIPSIPTNGTYLRISVFVYDDTNGMMINRAATDICSLRLLTPVVDNIIDNTPDECTFSVIDNGSSTALEKSLLATGKYVLMIQGKDIVFSGIIRRVTQNTQNSYSSTTQVKQYDIECDSDLQKLQNINVQNSVLTGNPSTVSMSPGNIARLIMTPASGAWDWRGDINCNDTAVSFQLYSSTTSDQIPSQYDLLMSLQNATNYDLITRHEYEIRQYTAAEISGNQLLVEIDNAAFTTDSLVGKYCFIVSDYFHPLNYAWQASFDIANSIVDVTNNIIPNDTMVAFTGDTLPTGIVQGIAYYVINSTSTGFQISSTLAGSAITLSGSSGLTGQVLIAQMQAGIRSWGKITANTDTTITAESPVNLQYPQLYGGYVIIAHGPKVDFAIDLSTPSALGTFAVNKDIYQYNDNDDTRKLYTKVVVKGTDLFGKSISVSVSGVHAWENQRQYYNDSTYIRLKSEGYIYKNNYGIPIPVTGYVLFFQNTYGTSYAANHYNIYISSSVVGKTPVGAVVVFSGSGNAPNITTGIPYFIVTTDGDEIIQISATPGGSPLDLGGDATGSPIIVGPGGLIVNNSSGAFSSGSMANIPLSLNYTTLPGGLSASTTYYSYTTASAIPSLVLPLSTTPGSSITYADVTSAGTNVSVINGNNIQNSDISSSPAVWLYGHGYTIPSGSTMMLMKFDGTKMIVTTSGSTSEGTDSNGNTYTLVPIGVSYPAADFSGNGYLLAKRLYVGNASYVGTNAVLIGEEPATIGSIGTDSTYGSYIEFTDVGTRMYTTSLKVYPHGVGALIARTNYTESSPETGSPIEANGIYIKTLTVDTTTTYGSLDAYATAILTGYGTFYKKATAVVSISSLGIARPAVFQPNVQILTNLVSAISLTIKFSDTHFISFCTASGQTGYQTTDGGITWSNYTVPFGGNTPESAIVFDSLTAVVTVSNSHFWRTVDGGVTWTDLGTVTRVYMAVGGANIVAATSTMGYIINCIGDGHLWKTTNAGLTWTDMGAISGTMYGGIGAFTTNIIVMTSSTSNTLLRSTDGGSTFSTVTCGSLRAPAFCIWGLSATLGVVVTAAGEVCRSSDAGATWTVIGRPATASRVAASTNSGVIAFAAGNPTNTKLLVYVSSDAGVTWSTFVIPYPLVSQIALTSGYCYLFEKNPPSGAHVCRIQIPSLISSIARNTLPVVGDTIAIQESTTSTVDYEVVEVKVDFDNGKVTLTLGDYEVNTYISMLQKTIALGKTLT